ncbi:glycosyltransferase family 4 protein [Nitrospina gracilis]
MILLGFVDDLVNLKARFKLVMQILIALFLVLNGMKANQVGVLDWAWLGAGWTLLWIAGITNGFNLVDGQDGLSGGLAFLTCGFAAMVFWDRGIYEASFLAVLLAGSVLGFLFFNFPPCKNLPRQYGQPASGPPGISYFCQRLDRRVSGRGVFHPAHFHAGGADQRHGVCFLPSYFQGGKSLLPGCRPPAPPAGETRLHPSTVHLHSVRGDAVFRSDHADLHTQYRPHSVFHSPLSAVSGIECQPSDPDADSF